MLPSEKPNIIWIQSDQHNPAMIGAYGDTIIETPNLDRLADRGTIITGAYCASPICVPSRMSMLTGLYPHETEVWTNDQVLNSAIPTYAHSLGAIGYKSIQFGRMHFNGGDQSHGFSQRFVGDHSPNYPGSPRTVDHGVLTGTAGPDRISLKKSGRGQNAYQIHDEDVAKESIKYIDSIGSELRSGKDVQPISLSIGLMLPHQPFVARSEDYDLYDGKVGMPKIPPDVLEKCHPYIQWWRKRTGIETVDPKEVIRARTAYWALCHRTDKIIGSVMEALESNGLMDNTLIVYTSDHGEQAGEHGLWWKQTFYDNSALVPAIISWPGHIPQGLKLDNVINHFDLTATILDAAGAPPLPRSHGKSMLNMLNNGGKDWGNLAFSEYCMNDSDHGRSYSPNLGGTDVHSRPGGTQNRMVRLGEWKLNYYEGFEPQLFNMLEDPDETIDLNMAPSYAGIKSELIDRVLEGWDPSAIQHKMNIYKDEQGIIEDWARFIDPPDVIRWHLDPSMDILDDHFS